MLLKLIGGLREKTLFNYIMLILLSTAVGLASLLVGAVGFGFSLFLDFIRSPALLLLNILPLQLLTFFLYFLSRRAWVAFSFPALFVTVISAIHFFKVYIRGDPLIVADVLLIREAAAIVGSFSLQFNRRLYLSFAIFLIGVLISVFLLKHRPRGGKFRLIAAGVTAAISITLYASVYINDNVYENVYTDMALTEWSRAREFISKGFLFPLINSAQDVPALLFPNRHLPYWYDEADARNMLSDFQDIDIPKDQRVNIIVIQLEAYSDLSAFGVLDFKIDVYAPLRRLQAESVHGNLVTNVFGGMTIDTERLFLTGNLHLVPVNRQMNSFVHFLRNQGFFTEGLHVGDMWFYDRRPVNANLGFTEYFFLDDFPEDGSRYDAFFLPTVLDMYMSRDRSVPYFSFNVSYQNHGAYESAWTTEPHFIAQGDLSDEAFHILNNYLTGIYDTTWRLEEFIDRLRHDSYPVVVLLYGDHMPWLGNGHFVYHELGINIDAMTPEGFLNYFSTPYLIWANYAAREQVGHDFRGEGGCFSPAFLMGKLFDLLFWEGEAYMQALRELKRTIDIINPNLGVFREHGHITRELSDNALEQYRRLRAMEIYRRSNFFY